MSYGSDTTSFPAFSGTTGKRDLIRALLKTLESKSNDMSIVYRINNTDLDALTDKSTVYKAVNRFASA
jgi:hypothetical protein